MKIYETIGEPAEADCVIGHSFGTSVDGGSVNARLANQMLAYAAGRPMIADRTLVNALPDGDAQMAHIVEGAVTNIRLGKSARAETEADGTAEGSVGIKVGGIGTWGTLVAAHQYMEQEELRSPVMIAQAYHISRVARQAAKLGISSIIPGGLPKSFDKESEQIWTHSVLLWIPYNALGSLILRRRGQL